MSLTKKILIVEDDLPLLQVLRDKLTREGFSILEAKNGKEGLETALSEHPDLILLDIMLPVMDGIAVLKELHADAWGKDAKVIMLTNLSDTQNVADAITLGSHEFLVKSDWKIEDVVKVVRSKLKG
jgi:DNA-binding response OmpR family regulator